MTLIGTSTRLSDEADPRRTQKRVSTSPSGRMVLIDITSSDRLLILRKNLPGRWVDVMMAIERGETLEQVSRWAKVPPPCPYGCRFAKVATRDGDRWEEAPSGIDNLVTEQTHVGPACLAYYVGRIYAWYETALHDLADRRARLLA